MRASLVGVVVALLTLSACGGAADANAPIPADAWPTLDGVTVVASDGFTGIDGGEGHQTGGRELMLKTSAPASKAIDFVASELTESGWEPYKCTHQTVCRHYDGMLALFRTPFLSDRKRGAEVWVELIRDR